MSARLHSASTPTGDSTACAVPSVRSGLLFFPFSEAKGVLEGSAEIAAFAPDDLTVQVGCVAGPDGAPITFVWPTWCGQPSEGEARVAPFLNLGTLLAGALEVKSYGASLTAFDPYLVNGQRTFMETCWLPSLDARSIDVFIEAMEMAVSPGCAVFTHEFRGAASRVPVEATAFGLRREHVLVEILGAFVDHSDELEEQRHRQWACATRRAFAAMALPGGYPNFLPPGDVDRAAKSYGRNAERLMKAKRHYDTDNLFRSAIPLPVSTAMAGVRDLRSYRPRRKWHSPSGAPNSMTQRSRNATTTIHATAITGSARFDRRGCPNVSGDRGSRRASQSITGVSRKTALQPCLW
jgi:Berberine and berberine like